VRLPDRPRIGLVLCYSYLWAEESKAGQQEGSKDRPAAIVLARQDFGPSEVVYVVPITHSPPTRDNEKIPIPAAVKRHLGLDDNASWVDVTEINVFVWPGPDLRPIKRRRKSGSDDVSCFYGFLPRGLFKKIQRALALNHKQRRVQLTRRDS
jgi:hypothetical protein